MISNCSRTNKINTNDLVKYNINPNASLSPRFLKSVDKFILSLNNLGTIEIDTHVLAILADIHYIIYDSDYNIQKLTTNIPLLRPDFYEIFGNSNGIKFKLSHLLDSNQPNIILKNRIDYFFKKLSYKLNILEYSFDITNKVTYLKSHSELIKTLYSNGCRYFRYIDFKDLDLSKIKWEKCDFLGSCFNDANLNQAKFLNCKFIDVAFESANTSEVNIDMACELKKPSFLSRLQTFDMNIECDYKADYKNYTDDDKTKSLDSIYKYLIESNNESNKLYNIIKQNQISDFIIHAECKISLDLFEEKSLNIKWCGLQYKNLPKQIHLYTVHNLFKWLYYNNKCPLNRNINEFNILNLSQINNLIFKNMQKD